MTEEPETVICPKCYHQYIPICPLCNHQEGNEGDEEMEEEYTLKRG